MDYYCNEGKKYKYLCFRDSKILFYKGSIGALCEDCDLFG